jgi:hypothetical protein
VVGTVCFILLLLVAQYAAVVLAPKIGYQHPLRSTPGCGTTRCLVLAIPCCLFGEMGNCGP